MRKIRQNKIPKIIHHIWTSGNPVADKFLPFIDSWKRHNPDYTFMLWELNNLEYDKYALSTNRILKSDMHYEVKMDVVTWEILYLYGGIKVDVDMLCNKNFDPLLKFESFCGEFNPLKSPVDLCNAIIGIGKNNRVCLQIRDIINWQVITHWEKCFKSKMYKYCENPAKPFMAKFERVFDKSYFFPFSWDELYLRNKPFPSAYAIHFWGSCDPGGWMDDTGGKLPRRIWGSGKPKECDIGGSNEV